LRCFIAFLPNYSVIASGVCGVGSAHQQSVQLDERRQFDARSTHDHPTANHRIEHPTSDRNHQAGRSQYSKKLTRRSLFHAPNVDLEAIIGMPSIMDFQLLADMGRMNG
jgi:hypothetical protein